VINIGERHRQRAQRAVDHCVHTPVALPLAGCLAASAGVKTAAALNYQCSTGTFGAVLGVIIVTFALAIATARVTAIRTKSDPTLQPADD
jgi:hypothetical protein